MTERSQQPSPGEAETPPAPVAVHHVPSLAASKIHPSSSSFLHHLHTDPAASHITLAQGPTAVQAPPASRKRVPSPQIPNTSIPLEPAILAPGLIPQPLQSLPHSPNSPSRPGLPPSAMSMNNIPKFRNQPSLPMAGARRGSTSPTSPPEASSSRYQDTSPSGRPSIRRATSGRPRTAPHPALSSSTGPVSPEIEDLQPQRDPSPLISPEIADLLSTEQAGTPSARSPSKTPSITSSSSETDSCLAPFMLESNEFADSVAAGTMTPEEKLRSPRAPMTVLGRSGSLVPSSSKKGPMPSIDHFVTADAPTWSSFMRSYAHGRFDPNKIPNPPRPSGDLSPSDVPSAQSSPGKRSASLSHGLLNRPEARDTIDVLELAERSHTGPADRTSGLGIGPYLVAAHAGSSQAASGRTNASTKSSTSSARAMSSVSSGGASSISSSSTNPSSAPSTSASLTSPPGLSSRKTTIAARRANSSDSMERDVDEPRIASELSSSPRTTGAVRSSSAMNLKDRMRAQAASHGTSYHGAAATVRMAASSAHLSSADLAPLGMPSPERELMDPMASVVTPSRGGGSASKKGSASSDPGSSTPGRIFGRSSLRPVTDWAEAEINAAVPFLPPIAASPVGTPLEGPHGSSPDFKGKSKAVSPTRPSLLQPTSSRRASSPPPKARGGIVRQSRIPPASAPLDGLSSRPSADMRGDYFGSAALSPPPSSSSGTANRPGVDKPSLKDMSFTSFHSSRSSSSKTVTAGGSPQVLPDGSDNEDEHVEDEVSLDSDPESDDDTELQRRASILSNANSDPGARKHHLPMHDAEEIYQRLGYLPAPLPPDELLRRKALYRFNILHTAPDINFDRIAHLAKLVFSTKIVLIALTDSDTQWHKSESGLGAPSASRLNSICSHTLLAK